MVNSNRMAVWAARRLAWFALLLTPLAAAQTAPSPEDAMARTAHPGFEVATIKPSDPEMRSSGFHIRGRRVSCSNETLDNILMTAYNIHVKQIVDAPGWFDKDRYDIDGLPDVEGIPNAKQVQEMYRKLLTDRFGLAFHNESRELPVYALTVAKSGANLPNSQGDPNSFPSINGSENGGQRTSRFTNISIAGFALHLSLYVDRPVVDQTNLKGKFDFMLKWTYDDAKVTEADAAPSLFTAIQEQLGLKMEAVKVPVEVFVIDHVERPTGN